MTSSTTTTSLPAPSASGDVSNDQSNKNDKVTVKEYAAYFCYGFGQCFSYGIIGSFILIYYTDVVGISSAIASAIFLIARLWDAIFDPLVSGFMDSRAPRKSGKFRRWMKIAPIFVVVATICCFINPGISLTGKIVFCGATYILWGTCYAFSDIPFWSMSTVMSRNRQTRTDLVTIANIGVSAGIGMASIMMPVMLAQFEKSHTPSQSYLIAVAIMMLAGFIIMEFGYKFTKERVSAAAKGEKLTFGQVFQAAKANKYMLMILGVFFLKFFMEMVNNMMVYFFTYNMGDADLMTGFGLIGTFSALTYFLIPVLTRRYKKISIVRVLFVAEIIFRVIFFFVGYANTALTFVFIAITWCLYSMSNPILSAMLAETIEYSQVKTGYRAEAVVFGGQTFSSKLAIAIGGATTGLLLTFLGYQPNATQTPETLKGLFIIISILPALGALLKLLVLWKFDYTEDVFKKCQQILIQRGAAGYETSSDDIPSDPKDIQEGILDE
ncbi:MFS transporter [Bifidobacterium choloepi]|uniref:Sugar transporter n=1 Tax=Bifidobacterium choloepi TaxID=2614131 RepID=A0A6I5N1T5_9BIFI|nr:glycoside-pentoside-hexuronide (GPH):cation symporter [Bifidobacterium choloepi]NEG69589.1 sugar transporter [Bifidobacterium choloepi]